jgi:UPF0148 protein
MRNPDEIMAEYLLKGGKMLSKACPVCGAPLFEYKGETFCVVCRENAEQKPGKAAETTTIPAVPETVRGAGEDAGAGESGSVADALRCTLLGLCERARTERRPEDCLILMECIERGVDALIRLTRP